MKRFCAALLTALTMLSLSACSRAPSMQEVEAPSVNEPPAAEKTASLPAPTPEELAAQQVEDLLSDMTLEEKVGQLFFVRCPAENAVSDVTDYHLDGYIFFGRDTKGKTANELI